MKQYTLNMVRHWLGSSIRHIRVGMETLDYQKGICLLDEDLTQLDSTSLYIGRPEVFRILLDNGAIPDTGAFVITCNGEYICGPLPANVTLVETSMSLTRLYNHIHEYVHRYASWTARMQQTIFENSGLQKLLDIATEEIPATITITNPGYKFMAASYHPQIADDIIQELQTLGYHTNEIIQKIRREAAACITSSRDLLEYVSASSGLYNIVHLIRYKNSLVARLVVTLQEPDPCFRDLTAILAGYVSQALLSSQGADYSSNAALGSLIADLIECRLSDPKELEQRRQQVQLVLRKYYHPVLVRINDPDDHGLFPWNHIMSQLQQAFRYCDVTTYRGDILLLARKTKRGSRPDFDQELLQRVLEQYDGRAVIGNASEHLSSLAPLYYQTKGVMRIATKMNPEKRIYFFEEYSIYQIVELAAQSEQHYLSSRNLAHLCNNELIALVLYDKKHGTNFTEVLFAYLINERNTTLTAKALYLHRNTMMYKINKIEEIIGCTLEDPLLRERLMFSYRVFIYMDKYLDDDILKLKQPASQKTPQ